MSLAQQMLDLAETKDGYRMACMSSSLNAAARVNQRYTPFFLENSDIEKLYTKIFKVPILSTMDVVVLHPSAENGYPHTRPDSIICLPSSVVKQSDDDSLINTLIHEAIHIHQRRYQDIWFTACKKEGWTPISESTIPEDFLLRCRLNPDTFSPQRFWAWETYNVPLPLFFREDYPTMDGIQIKWLDIRNNTLFSEPPSSFELRYGTNASQPEHPYELLAVEYAAKKIDSNELLLRKLESL